MAAALVDAGRVHATRSPGDPAIYHRSDSCRTITRRTPRPPSPSLQRLSNGCRYPGRGRRGRHSRSGRRHSLGRGLRGAHRRQLRGGPGTAIKLAQTPSSAARPLDIWMQGGGMDGLELLDLLKTRWIADLPVLIISNRSATAISRTAVPQRHQARRLRTSWKSPSSPTGCCSVVQRALEATALRHRENRRLKAAKTLSPTGLIGRSAAAQQLRPDDRQGRPGQQPGPDRRSARLGQGAGGAA